jgi:hypothetical protein
MLGTIVLPREGDRAFLWFVVAQVCGSQERGNSQALAEKLRSFGVDPDGVWDSMIFDRSIA